MNKFLVIVLLMLKLISYNLIECQNLPQIPCTNLFTYKFDGNSWYGFIQVPSPVLGDTLKLKVELSLRAQLPTQDVGTLELAHPRMVALQRIVHGEPTQYKIRFPIPQPIPKLTAIIYNSQTICSGPPDQGRVVTKIQLEHTLFTEAAKQQVENNQNVNPTPQLSYEDDFSYLNNQNHFPDDDASINVFNYNGADAPITVDSGIPPPQRPPPQIVQFQIRPQRPQPGQPPVNHPQQPPINLPPLSTRPTTSTTTTTTQLMTQPPSQPPPQQSYHQAEAAPAAPFWSTLPDEDICGMTESQYAVTPLVVGGTSIKRGDWPWLAGVYSTDGSTLSFKCGGNLVSKRLVVTAAHCINVGSKVYKANEIINYLGRFSIKRWDLEEGAMVRESAIVTAHPDYMRGNSNSFDADIAVIVLKTAVTYNQYIRPICLWTSTNDVREIEGKKGRVVGWGRDGEGNIVTPEPRKIDIPIVPEITCLRSSETFRRITSNRTFCAGSRDGSGPCSGDSGGGLALKNDDRWTLRGIVSVAALDPVTNVCNLKEYVVFTDAAKFTDWIQNFMSL